MWMTCHEGLRQDLPRCLVISEGVGPTAMLDDDDSILHGAEGSRGSTRCSIGTGWDGGEMLAWVWKRAGGRSCERRVRRNTLADGGLGDIARRDCTKVS